MRAREILGCKSITKPALVGQVHSRPPSFNDGPRFIIVGQGDGAEGRDPACADTSGNPALALRPGLAYIHSTVSTQRSAFQSTKPFHQQTIAMTSGGIPNTRGSRPKRRRPPSFLHVVSDQAGSARFDFALCCSEAALRPRSAALSDPLM